LKELVKKTIVNGLWGLMGRRNLVRFARFLTLEARLDAGNEIASNGERLVQRTALRIAEDAGGPAVIFDVGANVGDWTIPLLDILGPGGREDARIYSFEPCQATFDMLRSNLAPHPLSACVTPVRAALSNHVGSATLNVVGDGAGTNSLHAQFDGTPTRQETIQLTTADEFCRMQGLERVTLLKSDTEGHDMLVIDGASGLIERRAIDLIQFEYNHRWIFSRHYLVDAFERLMPHGYRIGKITARGIEFYRGWHFELESWREANFLACREEWCGSFPVIRWWNA
jgi:FkbM family methyltransferase